MLYFNCDYTEGCHPRILEKLAETNLTQTVGYGEDEYCQAARALIRKECGREDVDVHFLVGGTQANFTVIRAALRPHQGAIAPVTGHINGHETGAVEATGHKVLALPCGPEGKLTAAQVEETLAGFWQRTAVSRPQELPAALKNREMLLTQRAMLSAMELTGAACGSRGSALLESPEGVPLPGLGIRYQPGDNSHWGDWVETRLSPTGASSRFVPVRPLPKTDDWFESVWKEYRQRKKL